MTHTPTLTLNARRIYRTVISGIALLLLLLLVVVACGAPVPAPPDGNDPPPPGNGDDPPPGDPDACAFVISQDITVATRLSKTDRDCDYLFEPPSGRTSRGISVQNGPLIVDPGVVIKLGQDVIVTFSSGGSLQTVGTPDEPIRIEGAAPIRGYATGLRFNAGGSAPVNRLEHVEIAYLGREQTLGLFQNQRGAIDGDGLLSMKHTTIRGSNFHGAYLYRMSVVDFENNTFADNAMHPLYLAARDLAALDSASDYLGESLRLANGRPFVAVSGVGSDRSVTASATWRRLNAPYLVDVAIWVEAGAITIEPGTTFVFDEGASIRFSGPGTSLAAVGTADNPIRFIGEQPTPGYWNGIRFTDSSADNLMEHVEVRHGGSGPIYNANITLTIGAPYVRLKNSVVADSAGCGIELRSGLAEWEETAFDNNAGGDVCK